MDLCGHFRVFKRDKISILLTKKLSLFQPHREFKKINLQNNTLITLR